MIQRLKTFLISCSKYFFDIDGALRAGALAYTTLLSIVPLVALSLGFMIAFPSLSKYFKIFQDTIFHHLIPSSAYLIQRYVTQFADNATNLSISGITFLIVTSILLIYSTETVLNTIWKVKVRRKGWRALLIYTVVLIVIPPLGGLIVAISAYLFSLPYLSFMLSVVSYVLPLALSFLGFLLLYKFVPNCKVHFWHACVGAFTSAFLLEITKNIFSIYATYFSSDIIIYGVLSVIPLFIFWIFIFWIITIIGAIISYKISLPPVRKKSEGNIDGV